MSAVSTWAWGLIPDAFARGRLGGFSFSGWDPGSPQAPPTPGASRTRSGRPHPKVQSGMSSLQVSGLLADFKFTSHLTIPSLLQLPEVLPQQSQSRLV